MRTHAQRLLNGVENPERYQEVTITSAEAPIVLSVWLGRDSGPVVVFLPGTMTHPLFYEEFCDGLADAGINVVGVHLEGHGKSPRLNRVLRWDHLLSNTIDAVAWARQRFGRPPVLMGSSQGGVLAVAAAGSCELAGVVAHNVLYPALPSSLSISRFPTWLRPAYRPLQRALRLAALVVPRLPVPFAFYLDLDRVSGEAWTADQFRQDPPGLRSYPLAFVADLFTAELPGMTDGSIRCPVVVVAGRADPLFSLSYTEAVFARISAPSKELIVFDTDRHLLFNECLDLVLQPVMRQIERLSSEHSPTTTNNAASEAS